MGSLGLRLVVMLMLVVQCQLVIAGRRGQDAGGHQNRRGNYHGKGSGRDDHRSYGLQYAMTRDGRARSSRRRRSESRTPEKRRSSQPPATESPGYLEYRKQKQEAAAQQERRLQAQALAACLEERQAAAQAAAMQMNAHVAAPVGIPPLPGFQGQLFWQNAGQLGQAQPQGTPAVNQPPQGTPSANQAPAESLIPVHILKLIEAELAHCLSLGNKPMSSKELESALQQSKGKGKHLDQFITRHGSSSHAPPTRIAAKVKMLVSIAENLKY